MNMMIVKRILSATATAKTRLPISIQSKNLAVSTCYLDYWRQRNETAQHPKENPKTIPPVTHLAKVRTEAPKEFKKIHWQEICKSALLLYTENCITKTDMSVVYMRFLAKTTFSESDKCQTFGKSSHSVARKMPVRKVIKSFRYFSLNRENWFLLGLTDDFVATFFYNLTNYALWHVLLRCTVKSFTVGISWCFLVPSCPIQVVFFPAISRQDLKFRLGRQLASSCSVVRLPNLSFKTKSVQCSIWRPIDGDDALITFK